MNEHKLGYIFARWRDGMPTHTSLFRACVWISTGLFAETRLKIISLTVPVCFVFFIFFSYKYIVWIWKSFSGLFLWRYNSGTSPPPATRQRIQWEPVTFAQENSIFLLKHPFLETIFQPSFNQKAVRSVVRSFDCRKLPTTENKLETYDRPNCFGFVEQPFTLNCLTPWVFPSILLYIHPQNLRTFKIKFQC